MAQIIEKEQTEPSKTQVKKATSKGTGKKQPRRGLCDKLHMARIPKKDVEAYNMIKIEFNDLSDPEMLNAASIADYVGVEFKSKNDQLRTY